jgi:N-ethylmaleimide reductase
MTTLFSPLETPSFIHLRNRTVMSAMSRSFAGDGYVATDEMRDYYRRRADNGAGLILTEGTIIHPSADGWKGAPRIANDEQAQSWRKVTDAVHEAGGAIACQLWHMGRISHSDFTGDAPVSSTSRAAEGMNRQNGKPFGEPRALAANEMPAIYAQFVAAAQRALAAGFDAIELHGATGYLIDQFLDANVNDRTDDYGGSIENRCRFLLELVREVVKTVPANRLLCRISPSRFMGGLYEWPDMEAMLAYLLPELSKAGLTALDVTCANSDYYQTSGKVIRLIRKDWPGIILGGASLTAAQADAELAEGLVDGVTWGRAFIANPDLVRKIESGADWLPFEDSMRNTLI